MHQLLHQISSRLFKPPAFTGLHVRLGEQNQLQIRWLSLERKEEELKIIDSGESWLTSETAEALPDPKLPVALVIEGHGILHKSIEQIDQQDHHLLQKVLPGAQAEHFVLQLTPSEKGGIVSLIRKEVLETIIEQLQAQAYSILSVTLGAFDAIILQPFLSDPLSLHFENHLFSFDSEGQFVGYQTTSDTQQLALQLEGQELSVQEILPYASAFKGILEYPSSVTLPLIKDQQLEYRHQRFFNLALPFTGIFMLLILLINTACYFHYKSKKEDLGISRYHTQNQLAELDSIKAQLKRQQLLLQHTSINQQTTISFYADQIAATLPEELQLEELQIFPIKGKRKDYSSDELVRYNKHRILIKGWCKSSRMYNEWIGTLKAIEWIKNARHIDYRDLNSKLAAFELHLDL